MTQADPHINSYEYFWIRLATKQDKKQIIQVQLKSLQVIAARDYSPRELKALLQSKQSPRNRFETIYVAEIGEQIVGFVALDKITNHLVGLFVDPEYTRIGIGSKLLETVEAEARHAGIRTLWVYSSLTAYRFYQAHKYQEMSKVELCVEGVAIPCIRFRKTLVHSPKSDRRVWLSLVLIVAIACILSVF